MSAQAMKRMARLALQRQAVDMEDISSVQTEDASRLGAPLIIDGVVGKLEATMARVEAAVQFKRQREDAEQHERTLDLIRRVEQLMPETAPAIDVESATNQSVERLEEMGDLMRSPLMPTALVDRLLGFIVRKRTKNDVIVSGMS
jgi:hypothetical protein